MEIRLTSSGPQLLHTKTNLLVRARSNKDLRRIIRFGKLDPGDGDGRGARVPEDRFPGLEVSDEVECLGCCYPRLRWKNSSA